MLDGTPESPPVKVNLGNNAAVGGDVVGRDKIVTNIHTIHQRTLTAAEEAEQARSIGLQLLAEGVSGFVQRLQASAGEGSARKPYKGLLDYRLGDAEDFFGRRHAIRELFESISSGSLTLLHSESGAGKTSLLQAGLSPHIIARGHLPLYLRPYNSQPSLSLKHVFVPDLSALPALASAPLRGFLQQVTSILGPMTGLYLLIDQFEEFFRYLDEGQRGTFIQELAECLEDASLNVRWLLALRAESFSQVATFSPRIHNPFANQYRLQRLTRAEAAEVVLEPARRRGIAFDPGLLEVMLDELGGAEIAPPQLQLVCSALVEELQPDETTITPAIYEREGRAPGILRGHLERVLSRDLQPAQRPAARRLLESLISSEQQRVVRSQAELVADLSARGITPATLDVILSQLVDSRLLRVEETDEGLTYELAHDYLLDEIRLDPAVQGRKAAQELLEQEVRAYRKFKTLLAAERLAVIEPYRAELHLTPEAEKLLAESRAEVEREQREEAARQQKELEDARKLAESEKRRAEERSQAAKRLTRRNQLITSAGLVAVLAAIVAVWFGIQSNQNLATANGANTQAAINLEAAVAQRNLALSRQLAAQAMSQLVQQPDLAFLLSVEASLAADTAEARQSLLRSVSFSPRLLTYRRAASVSSLAYSPDGKTLALGGFDEIALWDVSDPAAPVQLGKPLLEQTGPEAKLAFSPDGKLLATASGNTPLTLWDVTDPRAPSQLGDSIIRQPGTVSSVAFSSNSNLLAVGHFDSITLFDVSNPRAPAPLAAPLTGRAGPVSSLAFSRDRRTLASGSYDTVLLWDISDSHIPIQVGDPLTGHDHGVSSLIFSPDGRTLISGSMGAIILWDVSDPRATTRLGDPLPGDGVREQKSGVASSVALSSDGETLASSSDFSTIVLWDVTDPRNVIEKASLTGHMSSVLSAAFSPDGQTLVSAHSDGMVILWNADNARAPSPLGKPLAKHTGPVLSVAFSPDGKTLASGSQDDTILLWDVSNPSAPTLLGNPLAKHTAPVSSVAFSPDGKTLASGSEDGSIILWDVSNSRAVTPLGDPLVGNEHGQSEAGPVSGVAFSPDGRTLASAGRMGNTPAAIILPTIFLWNVTDREAPIRLAALADPNVSSVAFSANGIMLAVDLSLLDVHDPANPVSLASLSGATGSVSGVAFSPDGRMFAASQSDNTISLWDLSEPRAGTQLTTLSGHSGPVSSVAFSPNGRLLASGGEDNTVILWDMSVTGWQDTNCRRAGRNLTSEEWQRYFADVPYHQTCLLVHP